MTPTATAPVVPPATTVDPAVSPDERPPDAIESASRGSISRQRAALTAGIGYVLLFGLSIFALGILVARSTETPRWLGLAMIAAGTAYVIDTTAYTVLADYADHADTFLVMVAVPSVIAERWFGVWLLTRARRGLSA